MQPPASSSPISAKVDKSNPPIYRETPDITGTSAAVISTGKFIYFKKISRGQILMILNLL